MAGALGSRNAQSELFPIPLGRLSLLLAQDLNRILCVYVTCSTPYRGRSHQIPITLIHQPLPTDILQKYL